MFEILDSTYRGKVREKTILGNIATFDGTTLNLVGEDILVYPRSALKPFFCALFSEEIKTLCLMPHELALFVSSHNGELIHAKHVARFARRYNVNIDKLSLPAEKPLNLIHFKSESKLFHNSSGFHVGLCALAEKMGIKNYTELLSLEFLNRMKKVFKLQAQDFHLDGDGTPTYAFSISELAIAGYYLTRNPGFKTFNKNMNRFPYLIAGRGRIDSFKNKNILWSKEGAEGFLISTYLTGPEQYETTVIKLAHGRDDSSLKTILAKTVK